MSDEFDAGKHGAIVALPFSLADCTTGMSAEDLLFFGATGDYAVAPKGGSVVGISANCEAITAGTITLRAHKAGTEFADVGYPAPVSNSTNEETYATVRPGALVFDAGDKLGLSLTTTTTLDPTNTIDIEAVLFIQLAPK